MFAIVVSAFTSSVIAAVIFAMIARTFAEYGESALNALTGEQPPAIESRTAFREWQPRPVRATRPPRPQSLRAAA